MTAGNFPAVAGGFPTTAGNFPTVAGGFPMTAGNFPTVAGDFPTVAGYFSTVAGEISMDIPLQLSGTPSRQCVPAPLSSLITHH
jgi:hypothetical protein